MCPRAARVAPGSWTRAGLLAALLALPSCGAVKTTSSSSSSDSGLVPVSDRPVVTITSSGVAPPVLHLYERAAVTFVNQDGRPHEVKADLKVSNDARCAAISVGVLAAGESRQTSVLPEQLYCQYRDESSPDAKPFYGFILSH